MKPIPPENVHAAKKILADCCGRERPNIKKLAVLLGVPQPPATYQLVSGGAAGATVFPAVGIHAFSVYAMEKLGASWDALGAEDAADALSKHLDTLSAKR
jgi:hypothetical protein